MPQSIDDQMNGMPEGERGASASQLIHAPFSADKVQRLNEWQTNTGPGFPAPPFTCPNRGDGKHGDEGGDTGVLIATEGGWVCPHCDYSQNWAHAMMAARQISFVAILGPSGRVLGASSHHAINSRLADYQALAAQEKRGAAVMVECLLKRKEELERERSVRPEPLGLWTIYDHPTDFPDCYVARKWIIAPSNPAPSSTTEILRDANLENLRAKLPPGLTKIPRLPGDDPVVLETWI